MTNAIKRVVLFQAKMLFYFISLYTLIRLATDVFDIVFNTMILHVQYTNVMNMTFIIPLSLGLVIFITHKPAILRGISRKSFLIGSAISALACSLLFPVYLLLCYGVLSLLPVNMQSWSLGIAGGGYAVQWLIYFVPVCLFVVSFTFLLEILHYRFFKGRLILVFVGAYVAVPSVLILWFLKELETNHVAFVQWLESTAGVFGLTLKGAFLFPTVAGNTVLLLGGILCMLLIAVITLRTQLRKV